MSADEENLSFRRPARWTWLRVRRQSTPNVSICPGPSDGPKLANTKPKKLGTFSGVRITVLYQDLRRSDNAHSRFGYRRLSMC